MKTADSGRTAKKTVKFVDSQGQDPGQHLRQPDQPNSQNLPTEAKQEISYCYFCNKVAEFQCGNCQEATYCTFEHQKADWPSHKRRCVKPEDRLKELKKQATSLRRNLFEKLSKGHKYDCQAIITELIELNLEILRRFPGKEHELEYGASICFCVKLLTNIKNFNEAQEVLNKYMEEKAAFLSNTNDIPSKLNPESSKYQTTLKYVQSKLKLLSALCSLMHHGSRNSIEIYEVLLVHCQKFYGPESLEVSNVYFELAHYYNSRNHPKKAIGCFLMASKIRNQKGASCLYNAAILFMRKGEYQNAIKIFHQALDMVQREGESQKIKKALFFGLGYCYKKLNNFEQTVDYFEKGLCQAMSRKNSAAQSNRYPQEKIAKQILKKLAFIYRQEFEDNEAIKLPKEKGEGIPPDPVVSNQNLEQYWEIDNANAVKKKREDWIASFKNLVDKVKFKSNIPMANPLIEKTLFRNHFLDDKAEDSYVGKEGPSVVKMDLDCMTALTATEVRYIHELNRQLAEVKDKETMYDIVESSNFLQILSIEKKEKFFQINEKLRRPNENFYDYLPSSKAGKFKPGDEALKLNLGKLSKNGEQ